MKKYVLKTLVCSLVLLISVTFTFAEHSKANGNGNNHGHAYGKLKQKLDSYFKRLENEAYFSGSVLVAKEGKVLLQKGYGMANIEEGFKNKACTVQAIASLTKAFTSTSIMMLQERGLLNLNDTVDRYIPELPVGNQITIRQLLSHTSGLYEYTYNPSVWENSEQFHTPEQVMAYFIDQPLQFTPGTQWEYCNSGYILLGIIIERVSGMNYRDFIRLNILRPLKMRDSSYDPDDMDFPNKAVGYDDISVVPPLRTAYLHPTIPFACGAINSTVVDMYKWDQALYTERLISAESLAEMFSPVLNGYGYGWYIDNLMVDGQPHRHIWHWGAYPGFHGYFSRLVDDRITIILLRNTSPVLGTQDELKPIIIDVTEMLLEH